MLYNSQPVADANKITWDLKMGLTYIDYVRQKDLKRKRISMRPTNIVCHANKTALISCMYICAHCCLHFDMC